MTSKRGIHLLPLGYHPWTAEPDYWLELMQRTGIRVALVCSDGDGGLEACRLLAANGIQPVIRFTPTNLPRPFTEMAHVERFVAICHEHNMEAIVQAGNEPGDPREWRKGDVPKDWFAQFTAWWCNAARIIVERDGVAGFPDGPCYPQNPFPWIEATWPDWDAERCIYLGHFYGLNRPPLYPYDDVSRYGMPMTEAEHRAWLGPMYDVPGWREDLDAINRQRQLWADPGLEAGDDPTCWRGWEQVREWMLEEFGYVKRMALAEGGWTPGAVAGSGPNTDIRWPKPTPETVAKWTMDALGTASPLEFQCFWLLADSCMGGAGGWEQESWVSGWMQPTWGMEKPVIAALAGTVPPPPSDVRGKVEAARRHVGAAVAALT